MDRFQEIIEGVNSEGLCGIIVEGCNEYRQWLRRQQVKQFKTVLQPQLNVEEQKIRPECRNELTSLGNGGTVCNDDSVGLLAEQVPQFMATVNFVVNDNTTHAFYPASVSLAGIETSAQETEFLI